MFPQFDDNDFQSLTFKTVNQIGLFIIVIMMFLPNTRFTNKILNSKVLLFLLCVLYGIILIPIMIKGEMKVDFKTFEGIISLFSYRKFILVGWIHYIVTDPLCAILIYFDSLNRGIPHLITAPILFLTFMLCPVGLILYLIIRFVLLRVWFEWFKVGEEFKNKSYFGIWFGTSEFWSNVFGRKNNNALERKQE